MELTAPQTIAKVTVALAPAFASGFAVQQALQILDPLIKVQGNTKRAVTGLISLVLGLVVAFCGHLYILQSLLDATAGDATQAAATRISCWIDVPVSALIISAGTEGFNSIMKFLSYQKEGAKADAGVKKVTAVNTTTPDGKNGLSLMNG